MRSKNDIAMMPTLIHERTLQIVVNNLHFCLLGCCRGSDPNAKPNAKIPKDFPYYTEFDERAFSFLVIPKPEVSALPIEFCCSSIGQLIDWVLGLQELLRRIDIRNPKPLTRSMLARRVFCIMWFVRMS